MLVSVLFIFFVFEDDKNCSQHLLWHFLCLQKCDLVNHCVLIPMMALTTCKSFHFSPFTSEYNSDLSVASSSSSLWDYTLLQPISPAMCYCHIQATSGSYSTLQSSRKLEIIGFFVGKLQHSCRSGAWCASAATLHHSPVWRRYDSSHGTIVFV